MPLPTVITDLSTTTGSNSPSGTDSIGTSADDYIRAHAAFIAQVRDGSKNLEAGTATAPAVAFTGDSNTGIYSPGADQVALVGGGRVFLSGYGRVFIGGNSDVYGIGVCYSPARLLASQGFFIGASDSATPDLIFSDNAGNERWRITTGGVMKNTGNTQPAFHATLSTNQTSGTITVFDTETLDHGSCYNNATGLFTAPVAGTYFFNAKIVSFSSAVAGYAFLLEKNGTVQVAITAHNHAGGDTIDTTLFAVIALAANDTMEVGHSSLSSTTYVYGSNYSSFSGYLLG